MCFAPVSPAVDASGCRTGTERFSRQRALGCDAVYSEDVSPQQDYDGLRVVNLFASHAASR